MARKKATPYPVQVRRFVASLVDTPRRPFSAKTVYDEIEHPARHDFKSSIGAINQLLHKHWSDGELISFSDGNGTLLREEEFVAPGSAAVEHPQIFAALGTRSPKRGFQATSYADFHRAQAVAPAATNGAAQGEPEDVGPDSADPEESGEVDDPVSALVELARADGGEALEEYLHETTQTEPAPEWLPDALLRQWVTRPETLAFLRAGLERADTIERRQLILTGLQRRKTEVRSDSATAGELAKLCRSHAVWWDRSSYGAMQDYRLNGRDIPAEELHRVFGNDLDALTEEYESEVVVLTCLRFGVRTEDVQVLALEAGEELGDVAAAHVEEELNRLQARATFAEEEARDAERRLREENKKRQAAEHKYEALAEERKRERAKAGGEATQLGELNDRLGREVEQRAAVESERDALQDEVVRLAAKETELVELQAQVTQLEGDLALAQQDAERRHSAERELQDALRTIGELSVRLEQSTAGGVAAPTDARSLVELLDSAIGSLLAETSERMRNGEAGNDDQQLLAFAAHFVEFKRSLPNTIAASETEPAEEAAVAADEATDTLAEPAAAPLRDTGTEEPEAQPDEGTADDAGVATALTDEPAPRRRRSQRLGWVVRAIGGAGEIGGSAILASTPGGRHVLLDAGQRVRGIYGGDGSEFHYGVSGVEQLDAILLSHAHIDHCGSLPVLHRNQQARQSTPIPVYMSEPTEALAEVMMRDSAKIQHARERDLRELGESDWVEGMFGAKPAYDMEEVTRVLEATQPVTPYTSFEIPSAGISARFEPVAHVLGSCAIHLTDWESGTTLLYTGDLGPISDSQLTIPEFPIDQLSCADVVMMESTYGKPNPLDAGQSARKAPESRRKREIRRFYKLAEQALERGGFVLVPCFSLGRAQEVVRLIYDAPKSELGKARIYIGGMAERILEIYNDFAERGERDGGIRWVTAGQFPRTTSLHSWLENGMSYSDVAEELLANVDEPGVIIASPATLTGGWSKTFADQMVDDERHAVLFSGFLPRDDRVATQLSKWKKGDTYSLDGRKRKIQCEWERVGLSAHAPAEDLRLFARRLAERASGDVSFLCVHGLPEAQRLLAADIEQLDNVADARGLLNAQEWTHRP